MSEIAIRRIRPSDVAEVHRLNEAAIPHVNSVTEDFIRHHAEDAVYFKVAELDGRVAGALLCLSPGLDYDSLNYRWFSSNYDDFIYVDRIYVADFAQRRGIAGLLYQDLVDFSEGRAPLIACEVNVRPRNEPSLIFHRKFGFEEVGQQDTEGGKKRVSLLVKKL